MPFQFTFSIPQVFTNPFSPQSHQIAPERPNVNEPTSDDTTRLAAPSSSENRSLTRHPTLSSHDLSVDPDNSRKRGWEPSYPVPSSLRATATPTTAGGYLDTPAKYRDQAMLDDPVRAPTDDSIMEAMLDDLRPAKKRRTVTESIISTAYSAALIGTAVGFTVYRLWRDRGRAENYEDGEDGEKEVPPVETEAPPPPYQPQWNPGPSETKQVRSPARTQFAHRTKPVGASRLKRKLRRPAQARSRPGDIDSSFASSIPTGDDEDGLEAQMNVMSQRLAKLIEDGQRALGTEVVILSEAQEDEVDDGRGQWVEEEPAMAKSSAPGTPTNSQFLSAPSPSPAHHPRRRVAGPSSTPRRTRGLSSATPSKDRGDVQVLLEV